MIEAQNSEMGGIIATLKFRVSVLYIIIYTRGMCRPCQGCNRRTAKRAATNGQGM
jgi:hypothetical protein